MYRMFVCASLNKTIIFVPHDNRPISFKQTADNIRDLGYEVYTTRRTPR